MSNTKDEQWIKMYQLAKEYYVNNGNLQISIDYKTNNINLGKWISHQRDYYKNELLSQEQINLLEEIKMIWDIKEFLWQKNYQLAKKYYEEKGNLLVPYCYEIDNIKLGVWIHSQKQAYKNSFLEENKKDKRRGTLSKKQIDLLESIGMVWSIK